MLSQKQQGRHSTLSWSTGEKWLNLSYRVQFDVSLPAESALLSTRYKDGQDHMGEHRDDEKELDPLCPIASVSLGAARDFIFRHRDARGKQSCRQIEPVKLELAPGSLLLMNAPTNTFWYHSLPVRKKVLLPRINLTFRRILLKCKKWTSHGQVQIINQTSVAKTLLTTWPQFRLKGGPYWSGVSGQMDKSQI